MTDGALKGVFVTATDTGVGKTWLCAAVAEALRRRGIEVSVMKPYASGSWSDANILKRASGTAAPLAAITPAYVRRPATPLAVPLPGAAARWRRVCRAVKTAARAPGFSIIEGIGGALVPLEPGRDVADLIRASGLPAWIVARAGLGTLNHTLLTVEALRRRAIPIDRIFLNAWGGRSHVERTNLSLLRDHFKLPVTAAPFASGRNRARWADAFVESLRLTGDAA